MFSRVVEIIVPDYPFTALFNREYKVKNALTLERIMIMAKKFGMSQIHSRSTKNPFSASHLIAFFLNRLQFKKTGQD